MTLRNYLFVKPDRYKSIRMDQSSSFHDGHSLLARRSLMIFKPPLAEPDVPPVNIRIKIISIRKPPQMIIISSCRIRLLLLLRYI